jgi:hypothetical protein
VHRHTYASLREKRLEFWVAFAAWFVFNIAAVYVIYLNSARTVVAPALQSLLMLANLAVPIFLAFIRPYAALGILVAFGTGLWLVVIEGIAFTASDFMPGSSVTGDVSMGQWAFLVGGVVVGAVAAFFVLRPIHRRIR